MATTVHAALRLSAIAIAAGTIMGLASSAAAQSRLERAERALALAQQELDAARGESAHQSRLPGDEESAACEGCQGCDDQPGLMADDEDDDGAAGEPGQRRIERRIVVHGDGPVCPICGRPFQGDGRMKVRGMTLPGGLGGIMRGGQPMKMQVFGLGGDEEGPFHVQTRGKVIIMDDKGRRREFSFGGPDGEGREPARRERRIEIQRGGDGDEGPEEGGRKRRIEVRVFGDGDEAPAKAGQKHRIEIHGPGGEGMGGEGGPHGVFRMDGAGGGISGKVIIIGPDGQRREFNLGGMGGGDDQPPARRRGPRVQIEESGDGEPAQAHHSSGGEHRVIQFQKVSRGQAL